MAPQTLVRVHRRDLVALTTLAERDLTATFARFTSTDAVRVRDALTAALPTLAATYGAAAATLAADWYDEARAAQNAAGRFRAIPATLPDQGRTDALAGWAVEPLFSAEPDRVLTLEKLVGGFQRIVANADRRTVTGSAVVDPSARGWQRAGSGHTCSFCAMLISRGAVYSEATANFRSHDHCHCIAVPVFRD